MAKVEADERSRIVTLLHEHGGNRNKVSKICERSVSTVQAIAEAEGIPSEYSAPKNANSARRDFAKGERLALLNKAFEKGEALLKKAEDGKEFKELVIGIATLIDKRRVEDGQVSDRTEHRKGNNLKDFFEEIDEQSRREWAKNGHAS